MTVALTSSVERYAYSGPGDYSFNFPFPLTSDVYVSYIDTYGVPSDLELNTDYTIAANSDSDGGVVTITSPASSGGVITIERTLSFTQDTVFENEGPLQMSLIEGAFDRNVMLLQQMNELIDGLKVSISWRYEWTADTEYVTKDVVTEPEGNDWYQCIVDNTSGDTFTIDVASGYWVKVLDFTTITNAIASAFEGVYPVPTVADEGKVPVVQSDASMAYEDLTGDIEDITGDIEGITGDIEALQESASEKVLLWSGVAAHDDTIDWTATGRKLSEFDLVVVGTAAYDGTVRSISDQMESTYVKGVPNYSISGQNHIPLYRFYVNNVSYTGLLYDVSDYSVRPSFPISNGSIQVRRRVVNIWGVKI